MGSLKSEGEVKMSSDRGARRICSLNLPSKAGQEVFKWVEVTVRGVLNCQDRARKRDRQKGNSKVIGSFGVREIEPRPHICWARPLLLSYTLSPHFLFWDRVSLNHPGLEFLILLPPPSKQLRWQAGLCNRNHTSWFKKVILFCTQNNTWKSGKWKNANGNEDSTVFGTKLLSVDCGESCACIKKYPEWLLQTTQEHTLALLRPWWQSPKI